MTLSLLDENDTQALKIDMLRAHIMKAGLGGNRLAQAWNDLALIAETVNAEHAAVGIPHPDVDVSPRPWAVHGNEQQRILRIRDANGRVIADRRFPPGYKAQHMRLLFVTFEAAIRMINEDPQSNAGNGS